LAFSGYMKNRIVSIAKYRSRLPRTAAFPN
jgi:hypothetical protein